MVNVHLSLSGKWVECTASKRACPRIFHLQVANLEEAKAMPMSVLLPLFESIDPPTVIHDNGDKLWLNAEGRMHRLHDLPALIHAEGLFRWYQDGRAHRKGDKPAAIYHDGTQAWYWQGERHREKGPAIIWPDGTQRWYLEGEELSEESHGYRMRAKRVRERLIRRGWTDEELDDWGIPE